MYRSDLEHQGTVPPEILWIIDIWVVVKPLPIVAPVGGTPNAAIGPFLSLDE